MKPEKLYNIPRNKIVKLYCDTIIPLVENNNPNDITVQMILAASYTSRTTFYRYFRDKYDLMNYVFSDTMREHVHLYTQGLNSFQDLIKICHTEFAKHSKYYKKLLQLSGQNSFREYYKNDWYEYNRMLLREYYGQENYTSSMDYANKIFCEGLAKMSFSWIEGNAEELDLDIIVQLCMKNLPNEFIPMIEGNKKQEKNSPLE